MAPVENNFPPRGPKIVLGRRLLGQHHENWLEYRTTCESLKHEKYLFLTRTEPYDSNAAFALLVRRVESLLSKENSAWARHARSGGQSPKENRQVEQ